MNKRTNKHSTVKTRKGESKLDKSEQFFAQNLDYLGSKIEGTDEEVSLFFAMLSKTAEIIDSEQFDYLPSSLIDAFHQVVEEIHEQS